MGASVPDRAKETASTVPHDIPLSTDLISHGEEQLANIDAVLHDVLGAEAFAAIDFLSGYWLYTLTRNRFTHL